LASEGCRGALRPDLDIQLGFINGVYALPGSLRALEQGVAGGLTAFLAGVII
jgi:hypothetical protein